MENKVFDMELSQYGTDYEEPTILSNVISITSSKNEELTLPECFFEQDQSYIVKYISRSEAMNDNEPTYFWFTGSSVRYTTIKKARFPIE